MYLIQIWAALHQRGGVLVDTFAVTLAISYNVLAHCAVVLAIVNFDLPPIPALLLALEQVS